MNLVASEPMTLQSYVMESREVKENLKKILISQENVLELSVFPYIIAVPCVYWFFNTTAPSENYD